MTRVCARLQYPAHLAASLVTVIVSGCMFLPTPPDEVSLPGGISRARSIVPQIALGISADEAIAFIGKEPDFSLPLIYPRDPLEALRYVRGRRRSYPLRADLSELVDEWLRVDQSITPEEWRHFILGRWKLAGDLYHSVPLDGSYRVMFFRVVRTYPNVFGGTGGGEYYTGLLVSPDGSISGSKVFLTYLWQSRTLDRMRKLGLFAGE